MATDSEGREQKDVDDRVCHAAVRNVTNPVANCFEVVESCHGRNGRHVVVKFFCVVVLWNVVELDANVEGKRTLLHGVPSCGGLAKRHHRTTKTQIVICIV